MISQQPSPVAQPAGAHPVPHLAPCTAAHALRVRIIHGYKLETATSIARRVLRTRRTCAVDCYLDCVTGWHEAAQLTKAFADAVGAPELERPAAFLEWYRAQHRPVRPQSTD